MGTRSARKRIYLAWLLERQVDVGLRCSVTATGARHLFVPLQFAMRFSVPLRSASAAGLSVRMRLMRGNRLASRSEEPTSELQSLMRISYAVFCLINTTNTNNKRQNSIHSSYSDMQ